MTLSELKNLSKKRPRVSFLLSLFSLPKKILKLNRKQRTKLALGSLVLIIILLPFLVYTLRNAGKSEAAWFDSNWAFRQIVAITNAGTAQTDYQISITLDTATLITAGKMRSDCNDIRITDINGRLIPYWIEESPTTNACNSSTTKIWTKVPSIPTSGASIYLYYGNPSATSVKNGYKTFEQFDDFNRADNATVGNNWLETDGAGSAEISSNQLKLSITNTTKNGVIAYKPYTTSSAVAMEYSTKNTTLYRAAQGFFVSLSSWTNIYTQEYATLAPYSTVSINKNYYVTGARQEATITSATTDTTNFYRGKVEILGTTDNYSWSLPGTNNFTDTQASVDNYSAVQNFGFTVWNDGSASNLPVSYIDWFSIRKTATTPPSVAAPASEENGPSPVAYWKFDDGTGTNAKDSSSNGNNGTLSGATLPTWQTEDQCISGKCLKFDGTDDYVSATDNTNLRLTNAFSINTWVKVSNLSKARYILSKGVFQTDGYILAITAAGAIDFYTSQASAYQRTESSNGIITANTWYHIEVVRSGTSVKIYKNGVEVSYQLTGSHTNPSGSANVVKIGSDSAGSFTWSGLIDDPKIYSYARSAAQVKADFSSRGGKASGNVLGASNANQNLSNGLVGFWKMDESSGAGSTLADSSGNGNTGTAVLWGGGNTATDSAHVAGKFGNSFSFDGGDDYINAGNGSSLNLGANDFTASAWVYPTTTSKKYFLQRSDLNDGWLIGLNCSSNIICIEVRENGTTNAVELDYSTTIQINTWYLVTVVKSGANITIYKNGVSVGTQAAYQNLSNSSVNFQMGRVDWWPPGNFQGQIDEVRLYNRALSTAEVSQLYNFAPGPVGYWNFEEGQGGTVNDTSGNANVGSWNGTGSHWTQGKYGKGGKFNGTDDYVQVTDSNSLDVSNTYTLGAWIYQTTQATTGHRIIDKNTAGVSDGYEFDTYNGGTTNPKLRLCAGNTCVNGNTVYTLNAWHYVAVAVNGTTATFYLDGAADGGGSIGVTTSTNALPLRIGLCGAGTCTGTYFPGKLDEIKVYNYARTSGQIVSDMNAGHPLGGSPVGSQILYLKFDEGYGTTANNSGNMASVSATLAGFSSPATTASGWTTNGKFGKALTFDGGNDVVTVGTTPLIGTGNTAFTTSLWMKPTKTLANGEYYFPIRLKQDTEFFWAFYQTGGIFYTYAVFRGSTQWGTALTQSDFVNKWNYISLVYNGGAKSTASSYQIYVNGVPIATGSTSFGAAGGSCNDNAVGSDADISCVNNLGLFQGMIDEVKVYNSALTAAEVKLDYNHGSTQVLGSVSNTSGITGGQVASNSASAAYCVPGDTATCSSPVGEWNFEEGSGGTVNDISGNANTGTWNGTGATRWASGKTGKAGKFNGSDDYISSASNTGISGDATFTMEAWFKTNTLTGQSIVFTGDSSTTLAAASLYINISSGAVSAEFAGSNGARTAGGLITTGRWYHLAVVKTPGAINTTTKIYLNGIEQALSTSSTNTPNITNGVAKIGQFGTSGSYFSGLIDQVRIFNYARSAAQVAWDYNRGGPVGYWKLDECQGSTANDSSGNGNTGTITIGATGTQTSVGTCTTASTAWGNGATGKYNASLNFDGTDDYVSCSDANCGGTSKLDGNGTATTGWTVSTWFKESATGGTLDLVGKSSSNGGVGYVMERNSSNKICMYFENTGACSSTTIASGTWYHATGVYNGSNIKIYVNGTLEATTNYSGGVTDTTAEFVIGARNNSGSSHNQYFPGQIDDTRIYNYALTKQQIQQTYNQGGAVRFGPATGTP